MSNTSHCAIVTIPVFAFINTYIAADLTYSSGQTVIASTCNFLEHIVSDVLVIQRLETNMLTLNLSLCSMSEVRIISLISTIASCAVATCITNVLLLVFKTYQYMYARLCTTLSAVASGSAYCRCLKTCSICC
jgi:hypothetical protein